MKKYLLFIVSVFLLVSCWSSTDSKLSDASQKILKAELSLDDTKGIFERYLIGESEWFLEKLNALEEKLVRENNPDYQKQYTLIHTFQTLEKIKQLGIEAKYDEQKNTAWVLSSQLATEESSVLSKPQILFLRASLLTTMREYDPAKEVLWELLQTINSDKKLSYLETPAKEIWAEIAYQTWDQASLATYGTQNSYHTKLILAKSALDTGDLKTVQKLAQELLTSPDRDLQARGYEMLSEIPTDPTQENVQKSIDYAQKWVEASMRYAPNYVNYARGYYMMNERAYDEYISYNLPVAIAMDPNLTDAYVYLGLFEYSRWDSAKALINLQKAKSSVEKDLSIGSSEKSKKTAEITTISDTLKSFDTLKKANDTAGILKLFADSKNPYVLLQTQRLNNGDFKDFIK